MMSRGFCVPPQREGPPLSFLDNPTPPHSLLIPPLPFPPRQSTGHPLIPPLSQCPIVCALDDEEWGVEQEVWQ